MKKFLLILAFAAVFAAGYATHKLTSAMCGGGSCDRHARMDCCKKDGSCDRHAKEGCCKGGKCDRHAGAGLEGQKECCKKEMDCCKKDSTGTMTGDCCPKDSTGMAGHGDCCKKSGGMESCERHGDKHEGHDH